MGRTNVTRFATETFGTLFQCLSTLKLKKFSCMSHHTAACAHCRCPSSAHLSLSLTFLQPLQAVEDVVRSLSASSLSTRPNPSLSSPHVSCAPAPAISTTLFWTHYGSATSLPYQRVPKVDKILKMCPHECQVNGKKHFL